MNDWYEPQRAEVMRQLLGMNKIREGFQPLGGYGLKNRIVRFIDLVRTAMYPHVYQEEISRPESLESVVSAALAQAGALLYGMCCDVQGSYQQNGTMSAEDLQSAATHTVSSFMEELPEIARILSTDIRAAYEGDPAARSEQEIILAYPAFEAISIYRLAHALFRLGVPLIPRMMTEHAHRITGIDIHPGATIDESFFIDHGTGVVIGETCRIGKHVKLYQGVTLGAKSFPVGEDGVLVKGIKRHPDIGDGVVIYAGATILGGDTVIGKNAVIGGNVWLTHSVPEGEVIYNQLDGVSV